MGVICASMMLADMAAVLQSPQPCVFVGLAISSNLVGESDAYGEGSTDCTKHGTSAHSLTAYELEPQRD